MSSLGIHKYFITILYIIPFFAPRMNVIMFIYAFLLFFVLTPGVLVCLPPKGSKMVVAGVHALVFAIVWSLTHKMVWITSTTMMAYATVAPATTKPIIMGSPM
jgi:hypothetical protein